MKTDLLLFVLVAAPQEKAQDTMRSKPSNQLYAEGWDRIFKKAQQAKEESEWDVPSPPKAQLN